MTKIESVLRTAHLFIFITICVLVYGAWKVSLFKNPESSILVYLFWGIFITIIVGLIIHSLLHVKTKLGYYLGLCDYPQYQLY